MHVVLLQGTKAFGKWMVRWSCRVHERKRVSQLERSWHFNHLPKRLTGHQAEGEAISIQRRQEEGCAADGLVAYRAVEAVVEEDLSATPFKVAWDCHRLQMGRRHV